MISLIERTVMVLLFCGLMYECPEQEIHEAMRIVLDRDLDEEKVELEARIRDLEEKCLPKILQTREQVEQLFGKGILRKSHPSFHTALDGGFEYELPLEYCRLTVCYSNDYVIRVSLSTPGVIPGLGGPMSKPHYTRYCTNRIKALTDIMDLY